MDAIAAQGGQRSDAELAAAKAGGAHHIRSLDGVRALSIMLVLAGHLLPLGPKALQLNEAAASTGMALFFILSGFLITRLLLENNTLFDFLVKRLARIAPLAVLFAFVVFVFFNRDLGALGRELSFTLNYHPEAINRFNPHLWSLCVEVQFYLIMGLLFRFARPAAPLAILGLCGLVTVLKVIAHDPWSMRTELRGDELLAGSLLCLSVSGVFGDHARLWRRIEPFTPVLAVLLLLSGRPGLGPLDYGRAYLAMLLVGSVLVTRRAWLARALASRPMAYIAKISYALYIIHMGVWAAVTGRLGMGSTIGRMLVQRPITFAVTIPLAHLSTAYYETPWIAFGRKVIAAARRRRAGPAKAMSRAV
jgi:peptidoglycan/LPS O-acetylase OafA/YrhL